MTTSFANIRLKPLAALAVALLPTLLLGACATTDEPAPVRPAPGSIVENPAPPIAPRPAETDPVTEVPDETDARAPAGPASDIRQGVAPAHLAGRDVNRLALLLPLGSDNPRLREEAASMLQAAQLALFQRDDDDTVLIVLDSGGTEASARTAAQSAVAQGADVILGPVLANAVRGAARAAAPENVPVIAFSTDQSVAGSGTYLLSFPPEAEVARIVDYAASEGVSNFAIIGPDNPYGRRVSEAYSGAVARAGGRITIAQSYGSADINVMQIPAQRLAEFYREGERATGGRGKQAFEAVLLPEGGTALRSLAPLLPFYNSSMNRVQVLGTALWMQGDVVREPALEGGLFAGPDPEPRETFEAAYERVYGTDPSRLASLAFDAVSVGTTIAMGDPATRRFRAEDPAGFYGADGFVRFDTLGRPLRGLAVYEVRGGTVRVVDPAPRSALGVN